MPLVLVLKHFLAQRGLNVTFQGGVGSFLLTCMVVHHLQMMRADVTVQRDSTTDVLWAPGALAREAELAGPAAAAAAAAASKHRPSRPERVDALPRATLNLGYLLFTFLEYFGRRFNYRQHAIVLAPEPGRVSKMDWDVYDPARPRLLSLFSPGENAPGPRLARVQPPPRPQRSVASSPSPHSPRAPGPRPAVDDTADIGRNSYAVQGVQSALFVAFLSLAETLDKCRPPVGRANTPGARRRCLTVSPLAAVIAQDAKLRARADALCAEAVARGRPALGEEEVEAAEISGSESDEEGRGAPSYRPEPSAKRSRALVAAAAASSSSSDASTSDDDEDSETEAPLTRPSTVRAASDGSAAAVTDEPRTADQARRAVIAAASSSIPAPADHSAPAASRAIMVPRNAPAPGPASADLLAGMVGRLRRPRLIADLLSGKRERRIEDETITRGSWF